MLKIEYIKLSELKEYEKNARRHTNTDIKAIKNSIEEFGMCDPIGIWENNIIIEGHGRLQALKEMGYNEAPCIRLNHLSDEQRRAYAIAHNKTAELSAWDFSTLDDELNEIFDIDMTKFGFNFDEDEPEVEAIEDIFEVELPEEPRAKMGDVYQLGRHKLMCGDSTDQNDVKKLMGGYVADISFTSPPYNAGTTPTEVKMNNITKYNGNADNKTTEEYTTFLNKYIQNSLENSEFTFMNVQMLSNNKTALIDVLHDNKNVYADTIIWDKINSQPAMAKNVLNSEFEYVHIFSKKANRAIGTKEFRGTLSNIIHIQRQNQNEFSGIHNATFSIDFVSHFIKNFSSESVLDLFGGTGTTLIACEQLNRKCYMMELEPKYVDVIIDRWEKFTGEKAILLDE